MTDDCSRHRVTPQNRQVSGVDVDAQTRCAHYHTDHDVIAIQFACCGDYYPCFQCHNACVDHEPKRWPPKRFDERAVLCGICGVELTIQDYLDCENQCPDCEASFNPGCRDHLDRYFAVESADCLAESGDI